MKLRLWVIMFSVVLAAGLGGTAFAFHAGGVANCDGCHAMHAPKAGGMFLLLGSDQSSTCLNCHQNAAVSSYHIDTPDASMPTGTAPLQRTPGGDFGWLHKNYSYIVRSSTTKESGDDHGHNIVAKDFGYTPDATYTTAPGGTMPASQLACNSCHDPHGKYRRLSTGTVDVKGGTTIASGSYNTSPGNSAATPIPAGMAVGAYRLLAGSGYSNSQSGSISYPGVPAAVAPSTYNQTEATNQVRVAYGTATTGGQTTWSQWCATCHPNFHSTGNYVHPVDTGLGGTLATNYANYVGSGNMSGTQNVAGFGPFSSLVPFMENTGDYTVLGSHASNAGGYLNGPASSDQVGCLTCHRAHASGFTHMMRWNQDIEFDTYVNSGGSAVWPGTDTTPTQLQYAAGRLSAETQAAYYDRPVTVYGAYQRVIGCNKCHAMD